MKLTLLILFTSIISLQANESYSQRKLINLQLQNVTVAQAIDEIEATSDFNFIFNIKDVDLTRTIDIQAMNVSIENVLTQMFGNTLTDFVIKNKQIILKDRLQNDSVKSPKKQQNVRISGTITDNSGFPLAGVTVLNGDKTLGVATDVDGKFSIVVPSNTLTLVISYVGFETKTIVLAEVQDLNNLSIALNEQASALDEVFVTGYQTLSKERTAGSFDQVDAKQIQQRPSSPNIIDRLTGQVAGLNTNPAFGGTFEIRGRSSIIGTFAYPLIIVDGFPLADQTNLESINPEDVESITILKDASAASIWGSRAANGVVVVVTKKGNKNSSLSVEFSSFVEIEDKVDLDDFNWMSSAQEIDLDTEFIDKNWTNLSTIVPGRGSINDFHLAHIYRNGLSPDGNVWSQNTFDNFIEELKSRNINDQWEKYLLRSSLRTTHNLSVAGGGEKNSFFGSLSYTKKLDPSIGDQNDRITMNVRNVFDFNDKISFTAGMTAALRNVRENGLESQYGSGGPGGAIEMAQLVQPYDQLVDENGQYIQKYYSWNPWVSAERENLIGLPHTFNFLEEQRNRDVSSTLLDIRADFQLDVEILKGLKASSSFRYERNTNDLDNFQDMTLPSWRNTVNDFYVYNDDRGIYENRIPVGSQYLQQRSYSKGWVFKNTLSWDKTWGDHDLTVFAGGEYSRRFNESMLNRQFGYDKQSTSYLPINEIDLTSRRIINFANQSFSRIYSTTQLFDIQNQDNRFVSYFANLGYTYNDKYTLNGSFRIDQANIFGSNPDFRYKPLWSVGGAWDLGKEDFLTEANWMNRLRLRATYGLGGNSLFNVSPYPTAFNRNINWGNPYVSLYIYQPGNPDLKWEETATTDLGIDFAFLNNRISGSFDYYYKKSTDVYTFKALDPTNGFSQARVNYANIDNKGFEIVLNAEIIRSENFNWSLRTNFSTNKNEITKLLDTGVPTADGLTGGNAYIEGKPIGAMYGYNFAGLDENGEVLLYDSEGNTRSWRGTVPTDEVVYQGSRTPKNYGGISTTLQYKGFDLTINTNFQTGFVFRKSYNYASTGYGSGNNFDYDFSNIRVHEEWANRWMQAGDENITDVPKIFYNGVNPATGMSENRFDTSSMHRVWSQSTRNIHKGDYLRVQDIILGYSLPSKYLDQTFFKSFRVSGQVTNPFLFVKNDLGVDPVAPDTEAYQNLTRFTFGVRASF